MKRNKIFACGIAIGLVSTLGLQAFGAPTIEKITAYINHEFEFEFDGVRKDVPDGYHILVYEGRSYVPAKFVAESLGGSVEWKEDAKVISIKSPEPVIVTVPAITEAKDNESSKGSSTSEKGSYDYKKLPQTKDFDGYRVSALSYFAETQNKGDRLYLSIANIDCKTVRLDQIQTKMIADGKEYILSGKDARDFDTRWYADIQEDQTMEGYLRLPSDLKNAKTLHMELIIEVARDYKLVSETVTFDIAL